MQVTKYWKRYMNMYVRTSNKYSLNNYRTTCLNKYILLLILLENYQKQTYITITTCSCEHNTTWKKCTSKKVTLTMGQPSWHTIYKKSKHQPNPSHKSCIQNKETEIPIIFKCNPFETDKLSFPLILNTQSTHNQAKKLNLQIFSKHSIHSHQNRTSNYF